MARTPHTGTPTNSAAAQTARRATTCCAGGLCVASEGTSQRREHAARRARYLCPFFHRGVNYVSQRRRKSAHAAADAGEAGLSDRQRVGGMIGMVPDGILGVSFLTEEDEARAKREARAREEAVGAVSPRQGCGALGASTARQTAPMCSGAQSGARHALRLTCRGRACTFALLPPPPWTDDGASITRCDTITVHAPQPP